MQSSETDQNEWEVTCRFDNFLIQEGLCPGGDGGASATVVQSDGTEQLPTVAVAPSDEVPMDDGSGDVPMDDGSEVTGEPDVPSEPDMTGEPQFTSEPDGPSDVATFLQSLGRRGSPSGSISSADGGSGGGGEQGDVAGALDTNDGNLDDDDGDNDRMFLSELVQRAVLASCSACSVVSGVCSSPCPRTHCIVPASACHLLRMAPTSE